MMNYAAMDGHQVVQMPRLMLDDIERNFCFDSNKLEGINGATEEDLYALTSILRAPYLSIGLLEEAVRDYTGGKGVIRDRRSLDVRVGNHTPPRGGTDVLIALDWLLEAEAHGDLDPWAFHCLFLWLHPFTDGNGRLARSIWFRMQILKDANFIYSRLKAGGMMKAMYLDSLEVTNAESACWFRDMAKLRNFKDIFA